MKRLITLVLYICVIILAFWSYNTNIQNTKTTSQEISDPIVDLLNKRLEEKKIYEKLKILEVKRKKEKLKLLNNNIIHNNSKTSRSGTPLYNIPLSIELQEYTYNLCKKYDITYELVIGIIKTESNFDQYAKNINSNGSIDKGLMQINSCHKNLCKQLNITNLYNPYQNIKVGIILLSNICKKYNDIHESMMVYNMGETGAKRNWKKGIFKTKYSKLVVNNINMIVGD